MFMDSSCPSATACASPWGPGAARRSTGPFARTRSRGGPGPARGLRAEVDSAAAALARVEYGEALRAAAQRLAGVLDSVLALDADPLKNYVPDGVGLGIGQAYHVVGDAVTAPPVPGVQTVMDAADQQPAAVRESELPAFPAGRWGRRARASPTGLPVSPRRCGTCCSRQLRRTSDGRPSTRSTRANTTPEGNTTTHRTSTYISTAW